LWFFGSDYSKADKKNRSRKIKKENGIQETEGRRRKMDDRRQRTEDRRQRTEDGRQKTGELTRRTSASKPKTNLHFSPTAESTNGVPSIAEGDR